jgi:hypothetical protein
MPKFAGMGRWAPAAGRVPVVIALPLANAMATPGTMFASSARLCASAAGPAWLLIALTQPFKRSVLRKHELQRVDHAAFATAVRREYRQASFLAEIELLRLQIGAKAD